MATMKDIADKLGISLGTVSKGLNNGKDISDELRKTILDTAVEMGYINRKALREDLRRIALFVENMDYEEETSFGYDIIMGFQKASFSEKWNFSVIPLTHSSLKINTKASCFRKNTVVPSLSVFHWMTRGPNS